MKTIKALLVIMLALFGWSSENVTAGVLSLPPDAPSNLILTPQSNGDMLLNWLDNSYNEQGFVIARSLDGISYTVIDTVAPNIVAYTNTGLTNSTLYYYEVEAYNSHGISGYCSPVSATTAVAASVSNLEQLNNNIVAYPNPATTTLTITNITGSTIINLYDSLGKLVIAKETEGNTTIDLSNLTQGIYTLVAEDKKGRAFKKVVITK